MPAVPAVPANSLGVPNWTFPMAFRSSFPLPEASDRTFPRRAWGGNPNTQTTFIVVSGHPTALPNLRFGREVR